MALIRFTNRPAGSLPRSFIDELPERFRQMFEGNMAFEPIAEPLGWMPAMEIFEKDDALVVTAELPGVSSKDVDITLDDGILTVRGEKKEERKEGEPESRYHMWERRYGSFQRAFTLPKAVDAAKIFAKFENGVLTITLPKSEKAKVQGRKIPISNGT
ncbi:MAG: Hsp20/alpha crystallin family protein [Gemmatimonadaceae bacterium]